MSSSDSGQSSQNEGHVARDAGSTTFAHVLGTGLRYLAALLTTRILGASLFGSFTLARTIVSLLSLIATVGLSPGLLPFLIRARRDKDLPKSRALVRSSWLIVILSSTLLAVLAWILAPWLAAHVFHDIALEEIIRWLSILILISALSTVVLVVAQAFGAVRAQAWIEWIVPVATTVIGLAVTWCLGLGISGVIFATLIGPPVGLFLGLRLSQRFVPGVFQRKAHCATLEMRSLARSSMPLMAANILTMIVLWMDVVLMGIFREPFEVGIYGACARLVPTVVLVRQGILPAFSARFSELHADGRWEGIRTLYQSTARWTVWWALVMGWIFVLWGAQVLALFGDEFVVGASVLAILSVGRVFSAASGLSSRVLMLTNRGTLILWSAVVLIACNLLLDLLWIPKFGGVGAAWASCISLSIVALIPVAQVWRFFRMSPWTTNTLLAVGTTCSVAGLSLLWQAQADSGSIWIFQLATFVAVCASVYAVWGMDDQERDALAALRAKFRR